MKKNITLLFPLLLIISSLSGCGQDPIYHDIRWENYDGELLYECKILHGQIPEYKGETPSKEKTQQYSYIFSGWSPDVVEATNDCTYVAYFESVVNKYTVTWKDDDGTVLDTELYEYGETPNFKGETPTKEKTQQYTYTFSGWSPNTFVPVRSNQEYTATYRTTTNKYTITFLNDDGTVLLSKEFYYGTYPSYSGTTPTKQKDAQYTYSFSGWFPSLSDVTSDQTYTATYSSTINTYTIRWMKGNSVLLTESYEYGETPSYKGETPTKDSTQQYTYTFSGWSPTVSCVECNIDYQAQFEETTNKYTITWLNYDGTVLDSEDVEYGVRPVYKGETPEEEGDGYYSYVFTGWSPSITTVTGNKTYTANFKQTVNKYTIRWVNYDNTVLQETQYTYGATPYYYSNQPIKSGGDEEHCYRFIGWDEEFATVTCDRTYTAQFEYSYAYDVKRLDGVNYAITKCYLYDRKTITIPSKYDGLYPISTIDYSAFSGCSAAEEIIIPNSIKELYHAFYGCNSLKNITIPSSVSLMSTSCFEYCTSLETVEICNGLTIIGNRAFANCPALSSISIPDSVNTIGNAAFTGCTSLEEIVLPSNLSTLGSDVFNSCTALSSIIIPDGVELINERLLRGCSSLKNVTLSKNIKTIYQNAFADCPLIESLDLPSTLETIDCYAFKNCASLTSLVFPNSLSTNGYGSLLGCSSLTSLTMPFVGYSQSSNNYLGYLFEIDHKTDSNSVKTKVPSTLSAIILSNKCTEIGDYAFFACSSITSISIPSSVTSIGTYAMSGCSITSIVIPSSVTSIGEYALRCNGLRTLELPTCSSIRNIYDASGYYEIPFENITICDGASSIPNNMFSGCKNLISVTIPETVTSIGEGAFSGCSSLTSITIPETVTSIGEGAFSGCSSLKSVVMPSSITRITNYMLSGCSSLEEIVIPSSVKTIGSYAFNYCSSLKTINIPSVVTNIGYAAFRYCTSLKSIDLPDNIQNIGENAFEGCSLIETINIPSSVSYISSNLFKDCSSLKAIIVPETISYISKGAFSGCSSLEKITLPYVGHNATSSRFIGYIFGASSYNENATYVPNSLKTVSLTSKCNSIAENAFYGCDFITSLIITNSFNSGSIHSSFSTTCPKCSLYYYGSAQDWVDFSYKQYFVETHLFETETGDEILNITLSDDITYLPDYIFFNCVNIKTVHLPESLQTLPNNAFAGCKSLISICLPDSVDYFGYETFKDCTSLREVKLPASIRYIPDSTFNNCNSLTTIQIPDSVAFIGYNAFRGCTSLKQINLSNNIVEISRCAFYDCVSLGSITIPESILLIDENAFYGCNSLNSVDIPYSKNTRVSESAFDKSICDVHINIKASYNEYFAFTNIKTRYNMYFYDIESGYEITSIIIDNTIDEIPDYAFYNFVNISEVTFSETVTSIGCYAFYGCSSLESVVIPSTVESIGNYSFSNCSSLNQLYYEGTIDEYISLDFNSFPLEKVYFFSETEPIEQGNYWHYVDGQPVAW